MMERVDDLRSITATWPVEHVALGIANADTLLGASGDLDHVFPIASITKLFSAYAALIALEEQSVTLDDPAGPPGATVRHLLAHASGLAFDTTAQHGGVGERRIYSNTGIEALAEHVAAATSIDFADYVREAVIEPLGLTSVVVAGSPAHGISASVRDLLRFGQELLSPTLIARSTLDAATTPVFAELRGVLPGFGSHDPNPWGLGFEIKGSKSPHWTSPRHGPSTFGHFGGAGSFLWVDPVRGLTAASAGDRAFGEWATTAWPLANTELLERYGSGTADA